MHIPTSFCRLKHLSGYIANNWLISQIIAFVWLQFVPRSLKEFSTMLPLRFSVSFWHQNLKGQLDLLLHWVIKFIQLLLSKRALKIQYFKCIQDSGLMWLPLQCLKFWESNPRFFAGRDRSTDFIFGEKYNFNQSLAGFRLFHGNVVWRYK